MNADSELQGLFDAGRTSHAIEQPQMGSLLAEANRRRRARTIRRRSAVAAFALIGGVVATSQLLADPSTEIVVADEGPQPTPSTVTTATTSEPSPTVTTTTTSQPPPTTTPPVAVNNPDLLGSGLDPRGGHSVAWVNDRLLIWGGFSDETGTTRYADGALFERETGTWVPLPDSPVEARWNHLTEVADDLVVVVGGNVQPFSEAFTTDAAVFDAEEMRWTAVEDAPFGVGSHTARHWINRDLYVVDPRSGRTARLDLDTGAWEELETIPGQDAYDTIELAASGDRLLAFQGRCGDVAASSMNVQRPRWEQHDARAWNSAIPNAAGFSPDACLQAASAIDGEIIVWAEPETTGTESLRMNVDTLALEQRDALPVSEGCELSPAVESLRSGATVITDLCQPTRLFDPDQGRWFTIESSGGAKDTVWTGDSMIVWGRECCYGTGTSNPFTNEIDEFLGADTEGAIG